MHASPVDHARPPAAAPVPMGPRAYRARVRAIGPLVALVIPAAFGVLSLLLLHGSTSAARGISGFGLAVLAAPGLLVMGAPLRSGGGTYLAGVAMSAALWFVLGVIAARRATRRPASSWRDFWGELLSLAVAVWIGVVVSLLVSNLVLGHALL